LTRLRLLGLCCLLLWSAPWRSEGALKAFVTVSTWSFDGTNLTVDMTVNIVGVPALRVQRSFVAANIADNTVILPGIRNQVIQFAQNQHGITLTAGEIAVVGSPL
jgi:hypothetical protein